MIPYLATSLAETSKTLRILLETLTILEITCVSSSNLILDETCRVFLKAESKQTRAMRTRKKNKKTKVINSDT